MNRYRVFCPSSRVALVDEAHRYGLARDFRYLPT